METELTASDFVLPAVLCWAMAATVIAVKAIGAWWNLRQRMKLCEPAANCWWNHTARKVAEGFKATGAKIDHGEVQVHGTVGGHTERLH